VKITGEGALSFEELTTAIQKVFARLEEQGGLQRDELLALPRAL
jgi:hypothetical protein